MPLAERGSVMLTLNISPRHSLGPFLRRFHHIRSLFSAQARQDVASDWVIL